MNLQHCTHFIFNGRYPTISILAGLAMPPDVDGTDLSPYFHDLASTTPKVAAFSEYPRCPSNVSEPWGDTTSCVHTDRTNFTVMVRRPAATIGCVSQITTRVLCLRDIAFGLPIIGILCGFPGTVRGWWGISPNHLWVKNCTTTQPTQKPISTPSKMSTLLTTPMPRELSQNCTPLLSISGQKTEKFRVTLTRSQRAETTTPLDIVH